MWTYVLLEGFCTRKWPRPETKYRCPKNPPKCPLKACSKRNEEVFPNKPQAACLAAENGKMCRWFSYGNDTKEFEQLRVYKDLWRKAEAVERLFKPLEKNVLKRMGFKHRYTNAMIRALNKEWDKCVKKVGGKR